MFGLKGTIVSGIIMSLVLSGAAYYILEFFQLRTAYEISSEQLKLQTHRRVVTEQATVQAEKDLYSNLEIQRHALQELNSTGHLSGNSNPSWMLEYQTKSN